MPEEFQGTPVRRSMATVTAAIQFVEVNENWAIEGSPGVEAGPRPIRVVISNENNVSCHFLALAETEQLIAKLTEALRVARTGLIVTNQLPPTEPNGHR